MTNQHAAMFVTKVGDNDVLLGRGMSVDNHEGNRRFRELVKVKKDEYLTTSCRQRKHEIAKDVMAEIANRKGNFLHLIRDPTELTKIGVPQHTSAWVITDKEIVLAKVKQALRARNTNKSTYPCSTVGESIFKDTSKPISSSEAVPPCQSSNVSTLSFEKAQNPCKTSSKESNFAFLQTNAFSTQPSASTGVSSAKKDSLPHHDSQQIGLLSVAPHLVAEPLCNRTNTAVGRVSPVTIVTSKDQVARAFSVFNQQAPAHVQQILANIQATAAPASMISAPLRSCIEILAAERLKREVALLQLRSLQMAQNNPGCFISQGHKRSSSSDNFICSQPPHKRMKLGDDNNNGADEMFLRLLATKHLVGLIKEKK